jgi:hypothetical protein
MDAAALRRALVAAGVPDGLYEIAGHHEPVPPAPDFVFLRPAASGRRGGRGSWEVGVYERGQHTVTHRFRSEEAACQYFYELLTGRSTEP